MGRCGIITHKLFLIYYILSAYLLASRFPSSRKFLSVLCSRSSFTLSSLPQGAASISAHRPYLSITLIASDLDAMSKKERDHT